jgi:microcystin-dependent protein
MDDIDAYIGQLLWVGFNFAPAGWAPAAGSVIPIEQELPLFDLFGYAFGGVENSTFALPDLRGAVIVGSAIAPPPGFALGQKGTLPGQGQGLTTLGLTPIVCLDGVFPPRQ